MSENPEITVVRECYEALAKADLDHARDHLLADDVVFHVPGEGSLAGDHTGKDQVLSYLSRLGQQGGDALQLEPYSFLTGDDGQVAALLHVRGERNGKVLDERGVHVFRVTGGKISERWSFPQNSSLIDEFFA